MFKRMWNRWGDIEKKRYTASIRDMEISFRGAHITKEQGDAAHALLLPYRTDIASIPPCTYEKKESALLLPLDASILEKTKKVVDELVTTPLETLVLVGIGGSSRGAEAVLKLIKAPQCTVLDELNTEKTQETIARISSLSESSKFLIIVVSKSGKTIEPLAHIETLYGALHQQFPDIASRILAISTDDSPLLQNAKEKNIRTLSFPEAVSGRFSVFSPVGLAPLYALGVDVSSFIEGGKEPLQTLQHADKVDPAVLHASFLTSAYQQGRHIHELYLLHKKFTALGAWYQQLLAESTGKESVGITPILSTPSDFHATLGLSLEGPPDKTTCFLSSVEEGNPLLHLQDTRLFEEASRGISGNIGDIHCLLWESVQETYEKRQTPRMSITLKNRSLREIGAFMSYAMLSTAYTAHLLGVDAFTQHAIDEYKQTARNKMQKNTI